MSTIIMLIVTSYKRIIQSDKKRFIFFLTIWNIFFIVKIDLIIPAHGLLYYTVLLFYTAELKLRHFCAAAPWSVVNQIRYFWEHGKLIHLLNIRRKIDYPFLLSCKFIPFRYTHDSSVATKQLVENVNLEERALFSRPIATKPHDLIL